MNDLKLNFNSDVKNVTMANSIDKDSKLLSPVTGDNNNNSQGLSSPTVPSQNQSPNLKISDPIGIEFLAKGTNSPPNSNENTPKSEKSDTKEEFNFFKPSDENKDITINELSNETDNMLVNDKNKENSSQDFKPIHNLSPQDIKNEKIDLLYKFKKLEGQGIRTTMNYNMNSHLEDMRNEYIKLKKQREIDNSVKFQRKVMMALITGLEFMNNKFDPFDIKLDGWSESVNENIEDFDEVFEELAEKYGGKSEMAPELKLLMMLGGSAFMFHLTQTLFKSSMPGMGDIMQQNPDLMKQFAKAAVGSMGNNIREPPPMQANIPRQPPVQEQRPEMSGPAGLDDLINQMNLQPNSVPDLDSISILSGNTDNSKSGGLTLNL